MKKDKYGIEIKVGDWVQLPFEITGEFSGEHTGKIFTVKEIKTKFLFLSKSPVVKAYPKNVMRVQPLTNQPSDFDNNYMGKKYTYVATFEQQLDCKDINYDMDWPYNVYGGMQDNGSWRGPAYIWRSGGIRNSYWD